MHGHCGGPLFDPGRRFNPFFNFGGGGGCHPPPHFGGGGCHPPPHFGGGGFQPPPQFGGGGCPPPPPPHFGGPPIFGFGPPIYLNPGIFGPNANNQTPAQTPAVQPPVKPVEQILQVQTVDLNVPENTKSHRTNDYAICKARVDSKLVVRRGQPFTIKITFCRVYDEQKDDLRLLFEAGDSPLPGNGTSITIILSHEDKKNEWGAKIDSNQGNTLTITIFTPPTTYVGQWKLMVDTLKKEATEVSIHRYVHKDPVYIIFNPWCTDDSVFLDDENKRKEYVLNQCGRIFDGSPNRITHKAWNYAQFQSCVLDTAMYLLDKSGMSWSVRGNPIFIVRKIAALVNADDDNGLMNGSWSGIYRDGISPTLWTGSGPIIEKYWKYKCPVKYGQCWVFAGLSTTICRTLGIPARCVTNFYSAHDTDGNLSLDCYQTTAGWHGEDSIWNFHVWNEAWMTRPDLPAGYGGWQAFDATPQETSDGVYCAGPAPVRAIREGKVNLPYDAQFVFSEVNADRVFWVKDSLGQYQPVEVIRDFVGKCISTKAIGSFTREDLTDQYKPKEGTAAERAQVSCAYQCASKKDISTLNQEVDQDVSFSVSETKENKLGENFELQLTIKNTSCKDRTVTGYFEVNTMYYTGVVAEQLKKDNLNKVTLQPNKEIVYNISVSPCEYDKKLKDFGMFDFSMGASVQETGQYFVKKESYRLHRPHLKVQAPTQANHEEEIHVAVSFTNPYNRTLTNCFVMVDGVSDSTKFVQGDVGPGATFNAVLPIKPNKVGTAELIVNFHSDELQDVNASHEMEICSHTCC